jgi:acylphosphatase
MSATGKAHHEIAHFSGQVQGVGFRYTTLLTARGFNVSGFVENLGDGRVRVEVEGEEEEVNAFLTAVEERMRGFVRHVERTAERRDPEFSSFTIR